MLRRTNTGKTGDSDGLVSPAAADEEESLVGSGHHSSHESSSSNSSSNSNNNNGDNNIGVGNGHVGTHGNGKGSLPSSSISTSPSSPAVAFYCPSWLLTIGLLILVAGGTYSQVVSPMNVVGDSGDEFRRDKHATSSSSLSKNEQKRSSVLTTQSRTWSSATRNQALSSSTTTAATSSGIPPPETALEAIARQAIDVAVATALDRFTESTNRPNNKNNNNSPSRRSSSSRRLPDFQHGGVVLFYHTPKTGGTSIRKNFASLPRVREQFLGSTQDLLFYQYDVELVLTQGLATDDDLRSSDGDVLESSKPLADILFLELHGPLPGMLEMAPFLRRWKTMAVEFDTAFFSFVLIREPLSYATSYFNFFWTKPCTFRGCPYTLYDPTVDNLVRTSKPNIQCLYLAREVTWVAFTDNQTVIPQVSALECAAVTEILLNDIDWVGTTEGLSTETLPLLAELLAPDHGGWEYALNLPVHNKMSVTQAVVVTTSDLFNATQRPALDAMQNLYRYDTAMYHAMQQVHTLERWSNFPRADLQAAIDDRARHPEKYSATPVVAEGYQGRNSKNRQRNNNDNDNTKQKSAAQAHAGANFQPTAQQKAERLKAAKLAREKQLRDNSHSNDNQMRVSGGAQGELAQSILDRRRERDERLRSIVARNKAAKEAADRHPTSKTYSANDEVVQAEEKEDEEEIGN